jgi:hypothetical protein
MSLGRLTWASLMVAVLVGGAGAQSTNGDQGGLDFLLPMGARTVGMGMAATAIAVGSDALWGNPALVARGPREAALQITQSLGTQTGTDFGAALIYSVPKVGTVGLSYRYLNYGQQASTDSTGEQSGTFFQQSSIFAATFAAPFGDRLSFGLTAKLLRISFPCTGDCSFTIGNAPAPQTGALDLGTQFIAKSDSTIIVGAALRNLGFKLQVNDTPQADQLPTRFYFGLATSPKLPQLSPDVRIRGAADIVWPLAGGGSPGFNLGGELSYRARYALRAGYVVNGPTGSGLTFGAGISTGKLQIDLARMLNDVSQQSGVTPTFVALRYLY